jgi:carbon-monoxide dehydrogenase medium subunit
MVAVVLRRDDAGVVTSASVAVGAVTDRPTRLPAVEALLVGSSGADAAADAGALAATLVDPPGSIHGSARYLRTVTGALTARAVERAS